MYGVSTVNEHDLQNGLGQDPDEEQEGSHNMRRAGRESQYAQGCRWRFYTQRWLFISCVILATPHGISNRKQLLPLVARGYARLRLLLSHPHRV
jgi:hypothetical protein